MKDRIGDLLKGMGAMVFISLIFNGCGGNMPVAPAGKSGASGQEFIFGMLLVGPVNDRGWSQGHYEGGKYAEAKLPGTRMVYIDKVNPSDRPGTTAAQLAEQLLNKGSRLIIFNSDDMKDDVIRFARSHPEIPVIHASGDNAWPAGKACQHLPNLTNVMGRVEDMKMLAGFAAALTTRTGRIAYLGPLINDETRRLVAAAYLGARHAWTKYLGKKSSDLQFSVNWIGYWFNIPGVTADPSQAAGDFFRRGYDVVISGLDSTEALQEARRNNTAANPCRAFSYGCSSGCQENPACCLGSISFNWGPAYLNEVKLVKEGTWKPAFRWIGPDWKDLDNPDTGAVRLVKGEGMSGNVSAKLDEFIKEMAGGLNLWAGPLNYQDGSVFLKSGELADDVRIWYLPQLLEGIEGQSVTHR